MENAYAKVNFFLHVTGQRPDGYHLLQSLAVFASLHDQVSLSPSKDEKDNLAITGTFGDLLKDNDPSNLVLKAIRLWRERFPKEHLGLQNACLQKMLPVAGGIGGGSADAAATLRILQQNSKYVTEEELYKLALDLGADVPVCLKNQAAIMEGIGEELTPVNIPEFGIILANPGVSVSTPVIFKALAEQRKNKQSNFTTHQTPEEITKNWVNSPKDQEQFIKLLSQTTHNDLEPPAINETPEIGQLLTALGQLDGALFSRMSGSGGTCFALFQDYKSAEKAQKQFQLDHSAKVWWSQAGTIASHF